MYSDILGEVEKDPWLSAKEDHQQKLENLRGKKKWQFLCMDDEDDIEAERVYCDVKNLQEEKTFKFYYRRDFDDFLS